jgi:hypothetical protein
LSWVLRPYRKSWVAVEKCLKYIFNMTDKFQWTAVRSPNTPLVFLNDRSIACSWYITNRKKAAFAIVLFPIQNIPDEEHYLSRKQVGSALTETENWDLLVDCTSRDGRKMLDAGVHLSDKDTLLMKTHRPFQTQYKIFYRIRFCFNKWWRNNGFYYI